jgi:hypothetical protein
MEATSPDQLVRRLIADDATAIGLLVERAGTSADPAVLTAAALVVPSWRPLLARASAVAESTRDRQLVAIATAYLTGDTARALLLARDHLAEHPNSLLAAHIAAAATRNH